MIVVDTSVWIDFLRGTQTPHTQRYKELLADGASLGLTGVIRMELLQGVQSADVATLRNELDALPVLDTSLADFDMAAELYRAARDAGTSVRNAVDCLIAAPCIRTGSALLHDDADFDKLAKLSDLRVVVAA